MATNISLTALFEPHKEELRNALTGLSLPSDNSKIQQIISQHLKNTLDREGTYRQSLTQAEDYILQAAISLLSAQENIGHALSKAHIEKGSIACIAQVPREDKQTNTDIRSLLDHNKAAILGAAGGSIAGNIIWTGWGGVIGAIAGVAVSIYLTEENSTSAPASIQMAAPRGLVDEKEIDPDKFISIVHNIYGSIDDLVGTYRAQVNRIISKYESKEPPTLEREYKSLLESLQSLIGYKDNMSGDDKSLNRLMQRLEDIVDQLDTYDLKVIDYSADRKQWFEHVPSPHTTEVKMVYPAIVKGEVVILQGKVFIPA